MVRASPPLWYVPLLRPYGECSLASVPEAADVERLRLLGAEASVALSIAVEWANWDIWEFEWTAFIKRADLLNHFLANRSGSAKQSPNKSDH